MAKWTIWALLLVAAATRCEALPVATQTINVDGVGTTSFQPLLLRILEKIMSRGKPTPFMTYRAAGTQQGQTEFLADPTAVNINYACGDTPLLEADAAGALNVPVLVSTVSIYANMPGLKSGALKLSPCTLARIFSGQIETWDDPAIKADNPEWIFTNIIPPGQLLFVAYRTSQSSSTFALSKYLSEAASTCGFTAPDFDFTKLTDITKKNAVGIEMFVKVDDRDGMAGAITQNAWHIGYLSSNVGTEVGLTEIQVQNKDGNWLTYAGSSTQVDPAGIALPNSLTGAWPAVSFVYQPGKFQWPMSLATYFYVRKDLTAQGLAGSLTKYLIKYFLSQEISEIMPQYGLFPYPITQTDRDKFSGELDALIKVAPGPAWVEEIDYNSLGQADYTISSFRDSFSRSVTEQLVTDMNATEFIIRQGGTYQLHGGGAFQAAPFMRSLMADLQSQARAPIHATYRVVGTVQAQKEFVDRSTSVANLNNFKVGDVPLTNNAWSSLTDTKDVMQLPFAVGSISIFFNQQTPANYFGVDACLLADIYLGNILNWNDPKLNDGAYNNIFATGEGAEAYVKQPIVVYGYQGQSSASLILTNWLNKACGSKWAAAGDLAPTWSSAVKTSYAPDRTRPNDLVPITTPDQMVAALASTAHSIGFLPSNLGIQQGLDEAYIVYGADVAVKASDADIQGTILAAFETEPFTKAASTADWSAFDPSQATPANRDKRPCPLATAMWVYVYTNMTGYGTSGPITRAFFEYMYSPAGQAMLPLSGLQPLPAQLVSRFKKELDKLIFAPLLTPWTFETPDSISNEGMKLQTFSGVRVSSEQALINAIQANVSTLTNQVATGLVVHVAGPQNAEVNTLIRSAMDDLTVFASYPVRFIFEEVSPESLPTIHLRLKTTDVVSKTHALVLDQSLTTEQWTELGASTGEVLQTPLMVRPLALVYNTANVTNTTANITTPPPLNISPCTLAAIMKGDIKGWDDARIAQDNPGVALPPNPILLYAPCSGQFCGTIKAVIDYCNLACGAGSLSFDTVSTDLQPSSGGIVDVVVSLPYSVLLVTPAPATSTPGIQTAALKAESDGTWVTPGQFIAEDYYACMEAKVGPDADLYKALWTDWSAFSLAGSCKANPTDAATVKVYPLLRTDFLVLLADLRPYGDSGGAIRGMTWYLLSEQWQNTTLRTKVPYVSGLFSELSGRSLQDILVLTRTPVDTPDWPLLADSAKTKGNDRPFVTSFTSPLYASSGQSSSDAQIIALAAAAGRQAAQTYLRTADIKGSDEKAKTIAIVALAMGLILALAALGIALIAWRDARRALAAAYRPSGLAAVLPPTQGMQYMANMNSNPPPLHPAASGTLVPVPSARGRTAAPLNPSFSYNSKTAMRKPASGRFTQNPLTACLSGGRPKEQDDRYQVFMDNHNGSNGSPSPTQSPHMDV